MQPGPKASRSDGSGCDLNQALKDPALSGQVGQVLWVPLHAEQEFMSGMFDALHNTVMVTRHDIQPAPGSIDCLMMQAVNRARLRRKDF